MYSWWSTTTVSGHKLDIIFFWGEGWGFNKYLFHVKLFKYSTQENIITLH